MQFFTLAVALFAAVATARSHGHAQRFRHRRTFNESSSALDLTTLTVQITSTHSVIGCAQNVTDCPARSATAIRTITEIVDLTTTVCPVASASDISSSVVASASAIQTPGAVISTKAAEPVQTSDSVLSYTLGTGATQSVVTTTIKHTITGYVTKYMTKSSGAQATPVVGGGQANVGGNDKGSGNGNANGNSGEPTTTVLTTSTATRTIHVKPTTSAGPGSPNGEGSNAGNGGDCAAPVTVTVALSTVTVTYTPPAATGTTPSVPYAVVPGKDAVKINAAAATQAAPEAPATTAEPTSGGASEEPVTIVTIPVIPVPYKNSTETATRNYSHSSGFLKAPRPTGTGSSIQPARTV
ncbi:hypothetical protein VC83_03973 [Pseudogymnoascus destructans]|uniref:Uncharacterized protein n=2 Tax=Pseudogymnoascus destructans TaxID=655981 RepID=L8G876_PSED2|nr:uncharacterized protein VC83_03973 [Pseudogymnoascus destructans]ELR09064.1 hypothetical protein GMDG_03650 [Pseudogymnoascus destructans 20631-21]OAF59470.1 hypothetical protein VC83_03973 [Pseudogymnoascus destructans]